MDDGMELLKHMSEHARAKLLELERERASRSAEALRLWNPHPYQKPVHIDPASELIVLGGNRSGKTLTSAVEIAWAITGTHPVEGRYPREDGKCLIVADGWRHIGNVIAPLLLRPGAFRIIKDEETGLWRAFDYVKDKGRKAEAKLSPPLIPDRMIEDQSWLLKSAWQLQTMHMKNGWDVQFFSSEGDPPQGVAADLVWVDEEIKRAGEWVGELQARLADRKGRMIYSAMPHSHDDALLALCERADKLAEQGVVDAPIKKYVFRFLDNPAIDEEEQQKMVARWAAQGDDILRMRAEGEFTFESITMYNQFNMGIHGMDRKELPDGQVPSDWCRFAAVDPGHAICAVLFAAIPPSGKFCLLYDELYIPNCTAILFAEEFEKKVRGQQFYAFYIDSHGARLTDIGGGKSPGQQYSEQLAERRVMSRTTGSSFVPGSDDVMAGIESVRNAMFIRPDGTPYLRVLKDSVPNFLREIKRYKRQANNVGGQTIILDRPHPRSVSHLMDCMRYLMAADIEYHKPVPIEEKPWWWEAKKKRDKEKGQGNAVYLAPASYSFSFEV